MAASTPAILIPPPMEEGDREAVEEASPLRRRRTLHTATPAIEAWLYPSANGDERFFLSYLAAGAVSISNSQPL